MEFSISYAPKVDLALKEFPSVPTDLNGDEWDLVSDTTKILESFELVTVEFSGEKYITAAVIITLIEGCIFTLKSLDLKTDAGKELNKVFINEVIPIRFEFIYSNSRLLDPRKASFQIRNF